MAKNCHWCAVPLIEDKEHHYRQCIENIDSRNKINSQFTREESKTWHKVCKMPNWAG